MPVSAELISMYWSQVEQEAREAARERYERTLELESDDEYAMYEVDYLELEAAVYGSYEDE